MRIRTQYRNEKENLELRERNTKENIGMEGNKGKRDNIKIPKQRT
jgi:hypothetical protein